MMVMAEPHKIIPSRYQLRITEPDKQQAQNHGNRLSKYSRNRSTGNAHVKAADQQQIQSHIQNGGNDKENQGRNAVTHCTQGCCTCIIKYRNQHAQQDNTEIRRSLFQQCVRGIEQEQQRLEECHRHNSQHQHRTGTQHNSSCNGFFHALLILSAEIPCGYDGKAIGQSHQKANHQGIEGIGCTHGCQCLFTQKAAHNTGIGQTVQQLE